MGKSKNSKIISEAEPLVMAKNKSSGFNAYFLVSLAFLQMLVSSGIILGWQSLANIIKDTGAYRFLCEDPSLPCVEEEVYLANLMSISQSVQMFSVLFLSILMDVIGPKFMAVCQFITALGTFMIAVGNPRGSIDYIWYGAILQNLCGCITSHRSFIYQIFSPRVEQLLHLHSQHFMAFHLLLSLLYN